MYKKNASMLTTRGKSDKKYKSNLRYLRSLLKPVYKRKTHNEHRKSLKIFNSMPLASLYAQYVVCTPWFEHFTSVLILLIQPVSDYVHSAVSVPMDKTYKNSPRYLRNLFNLLHCMLEPIYKHKTHCELRKSKKMLLPALRLGVNSDCSYTVQTLRAGAHITNSTGIRSRTFSRICTHGLDTVSDDELDHSFQRFHNS
ncbi:hypothetical protein T05_1997, partial [Trichinella murrelli]